MKGILADNNIKGQLTSLLYIWQGEIWHEIWDSLNLHIWTFEELGLEKDSPDDLVWQECQNRQIVLLTANRNDDGPDSLESTIRTKNSPECLPVFTLGNSQKVVEDGAYAAKVAVTLLQYFLEIDKVRGTGRLFVP